MDPARGAGDSEATVDADVSLTFSLGQIRYEVMNDGLLSFPPGLIYTGVPPEELASVFGEFLTEEGLLITPYNCGLVETGGRWMLLDTGIGSFAAEAEVDAGRLPESLRARGVEPEEIDTVVISHAHLDHVGGLMGRGAPRYPRARHLLTRDEWNFWMSEECERRLAGGLAEGEIGPVRECLQLIADADLLELVEGTTMVTTGIETRPAPGHTPGHMVVAVGGTKGSVLYLADAFLHEANLARPGWASAVDVDPELTVTTRADLFDRAAKDGSIVAAFHVASVGRIEKSGDAYRYRDAT